MRSTSDYAKHLTETPERHPIAAVIIVLLLARDESAESRGNRVPAGTGCFLWIWVIGCRCLGLLLPEQSAQFVEALDFLSLPEEESVTAYGNRVVASAEGPALLG